MSAAQTDLGAPVVVGLLAALDLVAPAEESRLDAVVPRPHALLSVGGIGTLFYIYN